VDDLYLLRDVTWILVGKLQPTPALLLFDLGMVSSEFPTNVRKYGESPGYPCQIDPNCRKNSTTQSRCWRMVAALRSFSPVPISVDDFYHIVIIKVPKMVKKVDKYLFRIRIILKCPEDLCSSITNGSATHSLTLSGWVLWRITRNDIVFPCLSRVHSSMNGAWVQWCSARSALQIVCNLNISQLVNTFSQQHSTLWYSSVEYWQVTPGPTWWWSHIVFDDVTRTGDNRQQEYVHGDIGGQICTHLVMMFFDVFCVSALPYQFSFGQIDRSFDTLFEISQPSYKYSTINSCFFPFTVPALLVFNLIIWYYMYCICDL
jgi:hypothetical protein